MAANVDVESAERRIRPYFNFTPVMASSYLNNLTGHNLFFKCENLQKTGSFKGRGAMNMILKAKEDGPVKGVVGWSGGNHGQGVAWAAQECKVPCTIVVPTAAPLKKIDAMKGYGSEVVIVENQMQACTAECEKIVKEQGYTLIDPMNDYTIMSGQGTIAKEFLAQVPDLDAILVSIGGGGLAGGVSKYIKDNKPSCKVFIVEPFGKDLQKSFEAGRRLHEYGLLMDTIADGCRPKAVGDKCFKVMRECCEHTVLSVTDDEIKVAMKLIIERMKLVVEGSAAMGLAAVLKHKEVLNKYTNIGLVLCGGNVDLSVLVGLPDYVEE
ncbi:hypothetical protein L596_009460 [Steinernema carpocapsae]|uniref:Tryptophan synthase beta chain-like PALP domain-containing protein n=1 Tax=Steinernema carpocapsae TaxID=34508 RepID=A0A4U5PFE8_STECR|nr:hypothetical protein L596_009460 [Steinernema carpocapsae]